MRITSTANPVVRYIRSLQSRRTRREEQQFLLEGVRLVGEAVSSIPQASIVLYDPEALERAPSGSFLLERIQTWSERVYEVDERVLRAAAQTEHPGGILAVAPLPEPATPDTALAGLGVILDGVADPGNAGTILRAADAFGARYVATVAPSVDLFAPKVVRAGMGAHFRLTLLADLAWEDLPGMLDGVELVASAAGRGVALPDFEWPDRVALVIGSEATGISATAATHIGRYVHIPIRTEVESLNAAMAASIMLYAALGTAISLES